MQIDFATLSPGQVYAQMVQTLVPRPVAWALSLNPDGSLNLAPFSYFNAVCSDPPLVMLSIGHKPDGSEKDTRVNIRERRHFVVHIAHRALAEAVTATAASLPAGESEVVRLGLRTTAFELSPLPRLAAARVAFACELYDYREIGPARQALILGRVNALYIDDEIVSETPDGRLRVHAERLDPIGRLGGSEYVTFGEILSIPRPP